MKRLLSIKKIFSNAEESENSGLFVSLPELIEQRKYISYLKKISSKISLSTQAGDVKSAFKGRGIELEEVRKYAYGDNVRDIDWRITARKDAPYTKLYAEEKDREIYVALDMSSYMVFGTKKQLKTVSGAKLVGLLGWLAHESKDKFGCLLSLEDDDYFFKANKTKQSLLAIFKTLSKKSQEVLKEQRTSQLRFYKSLKFLQKNVKNNATVFVISDFNFMNEDLQKAIAGLSKKFNVYLINIFDILEDIAPKSGEYMVSDNKQKIVFNSSSKLFQKTYKAHFELKRNAVKSFANKFGCTYMEVRGDIELYKQLKLF